MTSSTIGSTSNTRKFNNCASAHTPTNSPCTTTLDQRRFGGPQRASSSQFQINLSTLLRVRSGGRKGASCPLFGASRQSSGDKPEGVWLPRLCRSGGLLLREERCSVQRWLRALQPDSQRHSATNIPHKLQPRQTGGEKKR